MHTNKLLERLKMHDVFSLTLRFRESFIGKF